jgi:hypothetical protein
MRSLANLLIVTLSGVPRRDLVFNNPENGVNNTNQILQGGTEPEGCRLTWSWGTAKTNVLHRRVVEVV